MLIHLIGPGGAGKTTVGEELAHQLGRQFYDLDTHFTHTTGNISDYIDLHGYTDYARQNVEHYVALKATISGDAVLALSSGFMVYPTDVHPSYFTLKTSLEELATTYVLLPSFDLEECVEEIVRRQRSRPYLNGKRATEEAKIRKRFPLYMALSCKKILSASAPPDVAQLIVEEMHT